MFHLTIILIIGIVVSLVWLVSSVITNNERDREFLESLNKEEKR